MTPNMRNALPISTIIQLIKCIIRFWQECACLAQFQGSGRSRSGCTVTQIINMAELSRSGFVLFSLSPSLCLYHPLRDCPYLHSLLDSGGPTGLHIFWELRLMFMFTFQTLLAALNRTQQNTYNSGTQEFMTHDKKSTVVHHDCPYLNK